MFYTDTFSALNASLSTYVGTVSSSVASSFAGVATTLVTLYLVLFGWAVMRGMVSEPINDFLIRMVRISLITAGAINVGVYNSYVVEFLWTAPDALAAVVVGGGTPTVSFLDSLANQFHDAGGAYWRAGYAPGSFIPDFGNVFMAIFVWTAGILVTAYAAFLLALSKAGLAVLLGLGPLFVLTLLFEGTKRLFDAWLGQCLNFVFLAVVCAASVKLILSIAARYLTAAAGAIAANPTADQAMTAIALSLIGTLFLAQVPSIASALGGGVAVSTLGAAGWAYSKAAGLVGSSRPTSVRRSMHRAAADLRIAGNAGRAVVGAPMAVYRRVTGSGRNTVAKASGG